IALVVMVRRRSLAGFENGFLLTIALVLARTGALTAALGGVWLYLNAASGPAQGAVTDLKHNAGLIEPTLLRDVQMTVDQMAGVGADVGANVPRGGVKEIESALRTFQRVDPMLLELDVVDAEGKVFVSTSARGRREPLSRTAVGFALDG